MPLFPILFERIGRLSSVVVVGKEHVCAVVPFSNEVGNCVPPLERC
jgi:hypothetical protein